MLLIYLLLAGVQAFASPCNVNGNLVGPGAFVVSSGFTSSSVLYGDFCKSDNYVGSCINGVATYTHRPTAATCTRAALSDITNSINFASAADQYNDIGNWSSFNNCNAGPLPTAGTYTAPSARIDGSSYTLRMQTGSSLPC